MSCPKLSQATFGMQCFWGAEAIFGSIPSVITTRVGYSGGRSDNPTYRNLSDHIETVDVQFDSKKVAFEEILNKFFESHDASIKYKRQYISAAFYHDDEQKAAIESKINQLKSSGHSIVTEVIKYERFFNAENYHQKYFLRKEKSILSELGLTDQQIIESPLTCKLNAYISGFGTLDDLNNLPNNNLSTKSLEILKKRIQHGPDLIECNI